METIVKNPNNMLSVKHFSSKLEFAGRGAGHNHGVLWLDIGKLEQMIDAKVLNKLKNDYNPNDRNLCDGVLPNYNLKDQPLKTASQLSSDLEEFLSARNMGKDTTKHKKHRTLRYLIKLEKKYLENELNNREACVLKDLQKIYPLYGLKKSLKRLNTNDENVTMEDITIVTRFVDTFSTVSLHPAIVGSLVSTIAKKVNQHHHTKTCRKYKTICRFKFPKLPSYKTLITRPINKNLNDEEASSLKKKYEKILKKVKEALENDDLVNTILVKHPKDSETTVQEAIEGRKKRINALLESAGFVTREEKEEYQKALEVVKLLWPEILMKFGSTAIILRLLGPGMATRIFKWLSIILPSSTTLQSIIAKMIQVSLLVFNLK